MGFVLGHYLGFGFIGFVLVLVGIYHWPWITIRKPQNTQDVPTEAPKDPVDMFEIKYGDLLDIDTLCAEKPTGCVTWAMQTPEDRRAPYLFGGALTQMQFWKYMASRNSKRVSSYSRSCNV